MLTNRRLRLRVCDMTRNTWRHALFPMLLIDRTWLTLSIGPTDQVVAYFPSSWFVGPKPLHSNVLTNQRLGLRAL